MNEDGIMVGYTPHTKASRILVDTVDGFEIRETQNVVFDEPKTSEHLCKALRSSPDVDIRPAVGSYADMFVPALKRGRSDDEYVHEEQLPTTADIMDLLGGADPAEDDAESVGQEVPAAIDAAIEREADEAATTDAGEVGGAGPSRYPARQRRQVTNPAGPYQAYVGLTQDSRARDTIVEAKGRADWPLWREATNLELSSLAEKAVYEELPESEVLEGKKLVPTKWVFDYKRDSEAGIVDHKARWVAKGFHQNPGVDYGDAYAPTMQDSTLRRLLLYAAEW